MDALFDGPIHNTRIRRSRFQIRFYFEICSAASLKAALMISSLLTVHPTNAIPSSFMDLVHVYIFSALPLVKDVTILKPGLSVFMFDFCIQHTYDVLKINIMHLIFVTNVCNHTSFYFTT